MTKSLFKAEYSAYRKNKRDAHSRGEISFTNAINSHILFKNVYLNRNYTLPVSLKIWAYKIKNTI